MREEELDELMRLQRSMATRLRQENALDRKVKLLSIIQGLNPDRKGRILSEQIMVESVNEGFVEDEVDRLLDELETDGYLKRVDQGIMMLI
jgi:hypothetical protein